MGIPEQKVPSNRSKNTNNVAQSGVHLRFCLIVAVLYVMLEIPFALL